MDAPPAHAASGGLLHQADPDEQSRRQRPADDLHRLSAGMHEKVQAMPHIRYRPIEAGHNCIISAPGLVATELLEIPR